MSRDGSPTLRKPSSRRSRAFNVPRAWVIAACTTGTERNNARARLSNVASVALAWVKRHSANCRWAFHNVTSGRRSPT